MQSRKLILARLHLGRANLLQSIVGLPPHAYTIPLWNDWTIQSLLPHIALWDGLEAGRLHTAAHGDISDIPPSDVDKRNAEWHAQFKETPIENGIAMLLKERNGVLNVFETVPDEKLDDMLDLGEMSLPLIKPLSNGWEHDIDHTKDIEKFRQTNGFELREQGMKAVLLAYLRATPKALAALCALADDPTAPVAGGWSVHQLVSHCAGWEAVNLEGLRTLKSPPKDPADWETVNQAMTDARAEKPFAEVFSEYVGLRQQVIAHVTKLDDDALAVHLDNPYGWEDTPFKWTTIFAGHDIDHCDEMRPHLVDPQR